MWNWCVTIFKRKNYNKETAPLNASKHNSCNKLIQLFIFNNTHKNDSKPSHNNQKVTSDFLLHKNMHKSRSLLIAVIY